MKETRQSEDAPDVSRAGQPVQRAGFFSPAASTFCFKVILSRFAPMLALESSRLSPTEDAAAGAVA